MLIFKRKVLFGVLISILVIAISIALYFSLKPKPIDFHCYEPEVSLEPEIQPSPEPSKYIKWATFDLTKENLLKAYKIDVDSKGQISWIKVLAYAVAKNYGKVDSTTSKLIDEAANKIKAGETFENLTYYNFYHETYESVLGGFLGEREDGTYGMLVFSPIAKNYSFSHYDDFGNKRSYGFARTHKGNDLMGSIGTPIIAVESGTVEAMGWNQYGGWRIGIRTSDKKRYYYYAHLRSKRPFNANMEVGKEVKAGDVIGYLGMTGYSSKEGKNNIEVPHLHFGLQLIFDESQKEGSNQIWVDVYSLIDFLQKNKSAVEFNKETQDWNRKQS